ncbi:MAG: hypothetical protein ACLFUB_15415 [Cyclobacteriaceae bacterium]
MSTDDIFPEEEPRDPSERVRKRGAGGRLFSEDDYDAFDDENLLEFDEDEEALIYLDS